jgi:signal transduction histidine kinase
VPVSVLVEEACTRLAASRPGGLSRPQVSIERGLAPTLCDQEQVADALTRLLENACDVASDPARVRVQACSAAGADRSDGADRLIQIDVIDEGPGIPDPLLVRIFDPFYTTKANHVGLGLPLAQKLVRENGGRLLATSRFGQGSTFSILMPGAGE